MKFSIIIPVYNAENCIVRCIDSIFRSGIKDFEVILIDDGSTDCSNEVCKKLEKKYKQISYIYQENSGVSSARNNGINHAKGEYIIFCDIDDEYERNSFVSNDISESEWGDLVVYGMSMDYYHKERCYRRDYFCCSENGIISVEKWCEKFDTLYQKNVLSSACNKIFRRDIIDKYHLRFDEEMFLLEDLVFTVKYLAYCDKIFFINQNVYCYRQSEDEHNAQNRLEKIPSLNEFMKSIRNKILNSNKILFKRTGYEFQNMETVIYGIYYMLLSQKVYYAKVKEIEACAEELMNSNYCDKREVAKLGTRILDLYQNIETKKYWLIKVKNSWSHIRHRIAIIYKYCKFMIRENG